MNEILAAWLPAAALYASVVFWCADYKDDQNTRWRIFIATNGFNFRDSLDSLPYHFTRLLLSSGVNMGHMTTHGATAIAPILFKNK